jgi:serine/threonine protein kinase
MPDQVFSGKYIVQEILAKGGMGVIYKALDRTLNRVVAIKVVHEHLSGDPSFTERFLREARAMARLDHENIITIHAVEEERGTPYIVMEYCPGGNLRSIMQARKPLQLRTSIDIALQLAEALAYAHEQGIVHRDIKPANILVDNRGRVKLTDFGIAAALDEASITTVGQIIGTPEYMSPEQAAGRKVDARADIYSLGIVLYEMVVGHHPFQHLPKTAIHSQLIDTTQGEIPLEFPDNIPSLVKAIIEDLVRRDPEYRTATAKFLVAQLKECLQTFPSPSESVREEPTILVPPPTEKRDEPRRTPPPSEPPYPASPPSYPSSSEKGALSRKDDDRSGPVPATPEDKTDVLTKDRAKGRPATPHLTEPLWRRYNVLPLVAATVATALVLGGLAFILSRSEWSRSPEISHPPPEDQTVDTPATSDRDKGIQDHDKVAEGQTPEESAKITIMPEPEIELPIKMPSGKKTITASQKQLNKLLKDFQAAYEAQDLSSLQHLSEIGPDRQMFLDMMANNYSVIKVSIQNVSVKNDQATATLIHEKLVDKNGKRVDPTPILRTVRLTIRREGDHWSKVQW